MDLKPNTPADPSAVANLAIQALGRGYDATCDLRFSVCKDFCGASLIELADKEIHELVLPCGLTVPDVPIHIQCDKGERTHFRSDILSFQQMSEKFNQGLSLTGKIPLGVFNSMFNFTGAWQKDASGTKWLALDGWFYTLYTVEMSRSHIVLKDDVKNLVPSSWDPAALARFIENFGTHIITGVKVGGKDVIYLKQHQTSTLTSVESQKLLVQASEERFSNLEGLSSMGSKSYSHNDKLFLENQAWSAHVDVFSQIIHNEKQGITMIPRRRGGHINARSHLEWLHSVPLSPDVISMSFVPITSLLFGVSGSGFLSHAVNLYLRYKPPIEELHQFLDFQIPRQWAPAFNDLPLSLCRKECTSPTLQFSLMGPKLKVSIIPVTVGRKPVTGLRLYLEGKRCNRLAIHVQHLAEVPKILQAMGEERALAGDQQAWQDPEESNSRYFEPVLWKSFSHVCTAPVENSETWIGEPAGAWVVVGAQLGVTSFGMRSVLYLRLLYARIPDARIRRSEWDHTPASLHKTGMFSTLLTTTFSSTPQPPKPPPVVTDSGVFPAGPPKPLRVPKLLKYVDTTEMLKGPHDLPGHWLVTGAKLFLDNRKISLRVKYSLLSVSSDS